MSGRAAVRRVVEEKVNKLIDSVLIWDVVPQILHNPVSRLCSAAAVYFILLSSPVLVWLLMFQIRRRIKTLDVSASLLRFEHKESDKWRINVEIKGFSFNFPYLLIFFLTFWMSVIRRVLNLEADESLLRRPVSVAGDLWPQRFAKKKAKACLNVDPLTWKRFWFWLQSEAEVCVLFYFEGVVADAVLLGSIQTGSKVTSCLSLNVCPGVLLLRLCRKVF